MDKGLTTSSDFTAGAKQELGIRKECDLEETPKSGSCRQEYLSCPAFEDA